MNIEHKDISPTRKVVLVHYSAEEVASEDSRLLAEFTRQVKIPGFRSGKADPKMVRSRYAKEIKKELKQCLVQKSHQEGLSQVDFKIYRILEIETGSIESSAEATLQFTVDMIAAKLALDPGQANNYAYFECVGYWVRHWWCTGRGSDEGRERGKGELGECESIIQDIYMLWGCVWYGWF